jgi:hypothetical protein
LLAIEQEWDAYCLDQAVVEFSSALEAAMEQAGGNSKNPSMKAMWRNQVLARWLDLPAEQRFRAPQVGKS